MIAFASTPEAAARGFVSKMNEVILFPLITLLLGIALLVFLYGLFEFVKDAGSDDARETGKRHMLYGIIGMLIMLSAYAILTIAVNTIPGVEIPK